MLFQLPPSFKKDLTVLDDVLARLPKGARAAFEFRHASWHDPEVFQWLGRRRVALCIADIVRMMTPVAVTTDYAYFRLRDEGYQHDDLARWADTIISSTERCREVFVYFKHEEKGKAPRFAKRLIDLLK